ncbi:MAG: hypothetical protein IPL89_16165 [Acidobacteria bacterium]|nr:hypothetical protein [Acidobacteriota bacterium]
MKVKGRTAVFGAESPIAVVDTKVVNLASPVRASSLGAWAEPEFFVRVLGPLTGQALAWDKGTRTLSAKKSDFVGSRRGSPPSRSSATSRRSCPILAVAVVRGGGDAGTGRPALSGHAPHRAVARARPRFAARRASSSCAAAR